MSERDSLDGDEVGREYERRIANVSGGNPVFSYVAKEQMRAMGEQIMRSGVSTTRISGSGQSIGVKAGFIAEEFHAETFNLDAILKNDEARAYTDKYPEFRDAGYKINDTPDIVIIKDGVPQGEAQLKYYEDSKTTATQMRQLNPDGTHKYGEMDLIGPSDQISPTKGGASISDEARTAWLKNQETRPAVADAAKTVEEKASATLKHGDVESTPLSKAEAESIAHRPDTDAKKVGVENRYKTASTIRQMGQAAAGAAAMSAVVSGSINIVRYGVLVQEGRMTLSDATIKIAAETVASAADSAIKAAGTTGLQSLIVRYSSQELVRKITGQGVAALARSNVISATAVCAIDLVKDVTLFCAGRISVEELEQRSGKNLMVTPSAVFGGSLAAYACGGLAAGTFVAGAIPIVAGFAGGMICSMAMSLAIENGIEAPYRELVSNAASLRESARLLDDLSQNMFKGQVCFEQFLIEDARMDGLFSSRMLESTELSSAMKRAIDRI